MKHLIISAGYAIHDLYHHRLISFSLAVLVLVFTLGYFFSSFIVSGHTKVLIDYCVGAYHCFVIAFILICVVSLLKRIESCQILIWFLTNGCSRHAFIYGLWVGCCFILLIASILFYGTFILFCYQQTGHWFFYMWPPYVTYFFEGLLVLSFAFFWSQLLSTNMCYAALVGSYLTCMFNHSWFLYMQHHATGIKYLTTVGIHYLLPDLHLIDIQSQTLYELPINSFAFMCTLIYSALFCCILLLITGYVFKHKQLA